jgi:hypothetical protein
MELHIDASFNGYGRAGGGASITTIKWESDPEKAWKDGDAKAYIEAAREVCSRVLNVQLGLLLTLKTWIHRSKKQCFRRRIP